MGGVSRGFKKWMDKEGKVPAVASGVGGADGKTGEEGFGGGGGGDVGGGALLEGSGGRGGEEEAEGDGGELHGCRRGCGGGFGMVGDLLGVRRRRGDVYISQVCRLISCLAPLEFPRVQELARASGGFLQSPIFPANFRDHEVETRCSEIRASMVSIQDPEQTSAI